MNIDVLLVVLWIGCLVFGAGSGVVTQLFFCAGVYGGLILASQLSKPLAQGLALVFGPESLSFLHPVAYGLLFLVTTGLVGFGSHYLYPVRQLGRWRILDRLGGVGLAALWGAFLLAGLLITFQFLALREWPTGDETRRTLELGLVDSEVRPLLLKRAPLLPLALDPWFPEEARRF